MDEIRLKSGGQPFVLAQHHPWLHDIAINKLRGPVGFWLKMEALPRAKGTMPENARTALKHLMPEPGLSYSLRDGSQALED